MGRNKGYYNKDCERSRQEKQQMGGKYKNETAVPLKEKLTGKSMEKEIENDFINLYKNHYNACNSGFAKRILERNHFANYKEYQEGAQP